MTRNNDVCPSSHDAKANDSSPSFLLFKRGHPTCNFGTEYKVPCQLMVSFNFLVFLKSPKFYFSLLKFLQCLLCSRLLAMKIAMSSAWSSPLWHQSISGVEWMGAIAIHSNMSQNYGPYNIANKPFSFMGLLKIHHSISLENHTSKVSPLDCIYNKFVSQTNEGFLLAQVLHKCIFAQPRVAL